MAAALNYDNMEAVRIRAAGQLILNQNYIFTLMDAANRGKVLMFIKTTSQSGTRGRVMKAVDIDGSTQFNIVVINRRESKVGDDREAFASIKFNGDTRNITLEFERQPQLALTAEYIVPEAAPRQRIEIYDSAKQLVGQIDDKVSLDSVEVYMQKCLTKVQKTLVIALAMQACYDVFKIHKTTLPLLLASRASGSMWTNVQALQLGNLSYSGRNPLKLLGILKKVSIRAAGYSARTNRQYFDVIELTTRQTVITFETITHVHFGTAVAKDPTGQTLFVVRDLLHPHACDICNSPNNVYAYYSESKARFYTAEEEKLSMAIVKGVSETTYPRTPREAIDIYDHEFQKMAAVYAKDCSVKVDFLMPQEPWHKSLMLTVAIRAVFNLYGFYKLPMPEINYIYANQDSFRTAILS